MEIALPNIVSDTFTADATRSLIRVWVNVVNTFREWERKELIEKRPAPETLARHLRQSSALIRQAHMLGILMEDPDSPAREFISEIRGKLWQLQETRDMLHDPMSDSEADALLQKYFPNEPAVGKAA